MKTLLVCLIAGLLAFGTGIACAADSSPERLTKAHADLRIVYHAASDSLTNLMVIDGDRGRSFRPDEVIIEVPESARVILPDGLPFGPAGSPLWVLPQTQDPELPYIGISAEELPPIFAGALTVRLLRVNGPGSFFAWQADAFGLTIKMNAVDGIHGKDVTNPLAGSHEHMNWGFTAAGKYEVTLRAEGMLSDGRQLIGTESTFTFHVLPLSNEVSAFAAWQARHWPTDLAESIRGPDADPDSDGLANGLEFALGTDPKSVSPKPRLEVVSRSLNGVILHGLRFTRARGTEAHGWRVRVFEDAGSPGRTYLAGNPEVVAAGDLEHVTYWDERPSNGRGNRFYELQLDFLAP